VQLLRGAVLHHESMGRESGSRGPHRGREGGGAVKE
jgi:hypothetical protein